MKQTNVQVAYWGQTFGDLVVSKANNGMQPYDSR